MIKRAFDIVTALTLLILLSPLILVGGLCVAVFLGRPVLFRQVRPGLHAEPFELFKFRTMTDARGPDGTLLPDEARLTRFGRWLRSSSIDELPQLFNVLRGDISIIGPRPLLVKYLPLYTRIEARRHEVRPGITGWAQVNGRNALTWEKKLALDVWYVDNRSLKIECLIILKTIWTVITRSGTTGEGSVTMVELGTVRNGNVSPETNFD